MVPASAVLVKVQVLFAHLHNQKWVHMRGLYKRMWFLSPLGKGLGLMWRPSKVINSNAVYITASGKHGDSSLPCQQFHDVGKGLLQTSWAPCGRPGPSGGTRHHQITHSTHTITSILDLQHLHFTVFLLLLKDWYYLCSSIPGEGRRSFTVLYIVFYRFGFESCENNNRKTKT